MSGSAVTGGGTRSQPANLPDPCQATDKPGRAGDVLVQMRAMHAVLKPLHQDPARDAFWTARWETYLLLAARRVSSNRKQFYGLRAVAVISSVIVPSLVGLNLAGTGGIVVRWLTFALSLIAATSTATLALFRFGDRWFLYRDLQNELLRCGWILIAQFEAATAWLAFVAATDTAIDKYNGAYEADLIDVAKGKGEGTDK
jgi:Protein of unknown function (DUF4231)